MDDLLNSDLITKELTTTWLGKHVHFFPEIGSTNDYLKELARDGEPAGSMVVTDFQQSGKGRLNRRWYAPSGKALLFSLLFRPGWSTDRVNWLVMIAGLATSDAIRESALQVGIKWPNDVVVFHSNHWSKTAGILVETEANLDEVEFSVVGIGINVNQTEDELPENAMAPTSLHLASGLTWDRLNLLNGLLLQFEDRYRKAVAGESPQIDWNRNLVTIGQQVSVTQVGTREPIEGLAVGTDDRGWLLVEDDKNHIHGIPAGDVTLRG